MPPEAPPIPRWLDEESRKHWKRYAPWLLESGLLARLDQIALALLCDALSDFLASRDIVEAAAAAGEVRFLAKTDKGNIIQHPAVGVKNKAWERVLKLLREFGMTPSARAGLAIGANKDDRDPLMDLLMSRGRN